MKTIVLIPARYQSTRFPGKPLARIGGTEMIVRVCRRVAEAFGDLAVATDDERIRECVERNGFRAVMTSDAHRSGTDRVREAYDILGSDADIIINVQGDEPFIEPEQIRQLAACLENDPDAQLATLARRFNPEAGYEALEDPNVVKVVCSDAGRALYFSRSVIPFVRGAERSEWPHKVPFHTHVGIYAYRREALREITKLPQSSLELAESLEQLRWLQAGYAISVAVTEFPTIGIDTPADLEAAEAFLRRQE